MQLGTSGAKSPLPSQNVQGAGFLMGPALVVCSALAMGLAHPNPLISHGLWPLGYLGLIPLLWITHTQTSKQLLLCGFLFGLSYTAVIMHWMASYHVIALLVVLVVNSILFTLTLPLLGLLKKLGPYLGPLVQVSLLVAVDYLRGLGFLGNPYGVFGYTLASIPSLLGPADIGGVWLVEFLLLLPGAYWVQWTQKKGLAYGTRLGLILLGASLTFSWGYTALTTKDITHLPQKKLALIQHNVDTWVGDPVIFRNNLRTLIRLSNGTLSQNPELIVWSESAIAPAIEYHLRYRERTEYVQLAKELLSYLDTLPMPVLLGQNHAEKRGSGLGGEQVRIDYNAAWLYDGGPAGFYAKQHLVPFSEHFPFEGVFPQVYQYLLDEQQTFWTPGEEAKVFDVAGMKFSTPICFEDSFGYLSREFVNNGAEVLINLTNDSWAYSRTAMIQHLSMAQFRTVETRRAMARATNGGYTAIIDPNGRVIDSLAIFTEGSLVGTVPLVRDVKTVYLLWGDWFAQVMVALAALGILGSLALGLLKPRART